MGGVSGQNGPAGMPVLIRDGTKVQPLSVGVGSRLADQLMAVQLVFEDLLQAGQAVLARHRVETEIGPCLR
jgi:hypothetical protein